VICSNTCSRVASTALILTFLDREASWQITIPGIKKMKRYRAKLLNLKAIIKI
jgi:hypothetical protein